MQSVNVDEMVKDLIKRARKVPLPESKRSFLDIDHALMGSMARKYREAKGVRAMDVAKQIRISKVLLHRLEFGQKRWTAVILKGYLAAVDKLRGE